MKPKASKRKWKTIEILEGVVRVRPLASRDIRVELDSTGHLNSDVRAPLHVHEGARVRVTYEVETEGK